MQLWVVLQIGENLGGWAVVSESDVLRNRVCEAATECTFFCRSSNVLSVWQFCIHIGWRGHTNHEGIFCWWITSRVWWISTSMNSSRPHRSWLSSFHIRIHACWKECGWVPQCMEKHETLTLKFLYPNLDLLRLLLVKLTLQLCFKRKGISLVSNVTLRSFTVVQAYKEQHYLTSKNTTGKNQTSWLRTLLA